jgi:hypothetical protein
LRLRVGDIEYGYRVQGLFAHVLMRLGAEIVDLNAQGHPDVVAVLDSRRLLLEVEAIHSVNRKHAVKIEDIEAIRPTMPGDAGYLAVLDGAIPVRWALLEYEKLRLHGPSELPLGTIHALADRQLSEQCTANLIAMVLDNEHVLENLSFHLLAARACRGEHI